MSLARRASSRSCSPPTSAARPRATIIDSLRERACAKGIDGGAELKRAAQGRTEVRPRRGRRAAHPAARPEVIMMVGVNGTGKTTTSGKLAAVHAAPRPHRPALRRGYLPRRGHRAA